MTESPLAFRMTGYGSRRDFLSRAGAGCGTLALASLLAGEATADPDPRAPLAPRSGHHAPSASSVIWLFMHGAPSQVDTWDYKPELEKRDGKTLEGFDRFTGFCGGGNQISLSAQKRGNLQDVYHFCGDGALFG